MRVLALAGREFRSNWRRNAIFGAILFIAIAVQLVTALSATASRAAVETYGTAVFGYSQTYSMSLTDPLDAEQLKAFNAQLDAISHSYPWFRPATAVDVPGYLRVSPSAGDSAAPALTLRAVSPAWRLLTPAIAADDAWHTVTSDRRLGAAVLLEAATAQRLQITGPAAVTLLVDDASATAGDPTGSGSSNQDQSSESQSSQGQSNQDRSNEDQGSNQDRSGEPTGAQPSTGATGPAGSAAPADAPADAATGDSHRTALRDVPVFGTYTELNKSLAADALVNQNLLALAHLGPQATQVFWRCQQAQCPDMHGLVLTAATATGVRPGRAQRIDQIEQFRPILEQQREDGQRFAAIVLILGALAVAIVSTAFVEVRAPQFVTLRALGATRSAVGALALLENLFTALLVGAVAVLLGVAASRVDPDRFNQIPQVHLDQLAVPVSLYARTVALTIGIGLLTGLAPAVRAYRAVRTN